MNFWIRKFLIVALCLLISACDNSSTSASSYWQGWLSDTSGNPGWEFSHFDSRSDCLHALNFLANKGAPYSKGPLGCVFVSQNLPWMIAVDILYGAPGVKCIIREYNPAVQPRYDVILDAYPGDEAAGWRCIWKF